MGVSFLKSRMLRRARQSYNSGLYGRSSRQSRIIHFLFRDRESLDILARSCLRRKKFERAAKCYRKANRNGIALLDHHDNHFKSEIGSENYIQAYRILGKIKGKRNKNACISDLVRKLRKVTDSERVLAIQEMNEISPLPADISRLLPWAPKQVEYEESDDDYSTLKGEAISSERYQREIHRIKNSGAYLISKHITDAIRKPAKLIALPFSLPKLVVDLILNRKGVIGDPDSKTYVVNTSERRRDCIVLFPTNGVGFGHFTRLLSISRQIRQLNPETEIVFFTTMPTLHVLAEEGVVCYHMPGRYRYEDMDASQWNALCEEMLNLVFTLHRPKAFVFDGSFPYRGMLNSIKSNSNNLFKVWLRRGAIKKNSKNIPVDSIGHFNAIVRPGDSVGDDFDDETKHNIPIFKSNPIILQNLENNQNTSSIRHRMGIPKEALVCYVQLGAGQINDIESEIRITLEHLTSHDQVYTIVGESMLGERISFEHDRVRVLRDYPNSRYFHEFDFAIIAGGYNSFHEIIDAGLPAICFPNLNTGRDDQLSRAKVASDLGAMIVLESRNKANIGVSVSRMMDERTRRKMREQTQHLKLDNGSKEVSEWLITQISN